MGQVTLPVLNRKGFSDNWYNTWNKNYSYNTNLSEDAYLDIFFKIFFKNWLSSNHLNSYKYFNISKKYRIQKYIDYTYESSLKEFIKEFSIKRNKKFPYYISRLFIIKYNQWILLYSYIYVPKAWYKKFQKKKKRIYNYSYVVDLYNFHKRKCKYIKCNY